MRGDGLQVVRAKTRVEEEALAFEQRLDFLQRRPFGRLRVAAQARLHELEVFEDQVRLGFLGGKDGIGVEQLVFADHIGLRVDLLIRLDQLVGLVEPGVFEVMLAELDIGDAKQSNLHKGL